MLKFTAHLRAVFGNSSYLEVALILKHNPATSTHHFGKNNLKQNNNKKARHFKSIFASTCQQFTTSIHFKLTANIIALWSTKSFVLCCAILSCYVYEKEQSDAWWPNSVYADNGSFGQSHFMEQCVLTNMSATVLWAEWRARGAQTRDVVLGWPRWDHDSHRGGNKYNNETSTRLFLIILFVTVVVWSYAVFSVWP